MSNTGDDLKALLARPAAPLSSAEIALLFSTFSNNSTNKSMSLAILSRALSSSPDDLEITTTNLSKSINELLDSTNEVSLRVLRGIFQVSVKVGIELMKQISVRKKLEKIIKLQSLRVSSLELLVELASQSETRSLVRQFRPWLEGLLGDKTQKIEIIGEKNGQERERALAAIAVVKLVLGRDVEQEVIDRVETLESSKWEAKDLIILFRGMIIKHSINKEDGIFLIALEGLAYLTLVPSTKLKLLLGETEFLVALLSIVRMIDEDNSPLEYALASVLVNLLSYPRMEEAGSETEQLNRLKSFAQAKGEKNVISDKETAETVDDRIQIILRVTPSLLPILVKLSKSTAVSIRRAAGTLWLSLAEQSTVRPRLLQAGAAKSLLRIIEKIVIVSVDSNKGIEMSDINSIQALAKLLITNNPEIVLSTEEVRLNALNALLLPLILPTFNSSPSQLLLIKFESMMALTNLSSLQTGHFAERLSSLTLPNTSTKISGAKEPIKFLSILQDLVLHDNLLIRRASTELLCNLVSTSAGNQFYSPIPPSTTISKNLKLLIALISSEDSPTRLASSGAVAILTSDSKMLALSIVEDIDKKRNLEIILELLEQEAGIGLCLRGITLIISILEAVEQSSKRVESIKLLVEMKVKRAIEDCALEDKELMGLKEHSLVLLAKLK